MATTATDLPIATALDMATISELLGHGLRLTSAVGAVRSANIAWNEVATDGAVYLTVRRDARAPQGWVGKLAPSVPKPLRPGDHFVDLTAVAGRVRSRLQS